ncbi:calcium-binding protein [Haematospirillum sp. 15-248]|uniref:calcium-binding protein n=1 Tax=Haematospirillum sp. 15-248 TaxID=2723107 RepID=UPI00143900C4|nr:calcium-binding protein [Haematospirillum sp. 15-248]NKD88653.1 calcium-binding protein [Haematospirillum sp. 15-248]
MNKSILDGSHMAPLGDALLDIVYLARRRPAAWDIGVRGTDGDDRIDGHISNDWIFGDAGNDLIFAAEGDDVIRGGLGADSLYGDEGRDEFVYASVAEVKGDILKDFVSGEDTINLSGVGHFAFIADKPMPHALWTRKESQGALRLLGDTDGNPGTAEIDLLLDGPDVFIEDISFLTAADVGVGASVKASLVDLGSGSYDSSEPSWAGSTFFLLSSLFFGPWFSFLLPRPAPPRPVFYFLDAGADTSVGVVLDLTQHAEVLHASGTQGADTIIGNGRNNNLSGQAGDDILFGYAGCDALNGDEGDDILVGGPGDDMLTGGKGNDTLTGGEGADFFSYTPDCLGDDVILDFNFAQGDRIDLGMEIGNCSDCLAWSSNGPEDWSVWLIKSDNGIILYADTDGDSDAAEFSITLPGVFELSPSAINL